MLTMPVCIHCSQCAHSCKYAVAPAPKTSQQSGMNAHTRALLQLVCDGCLSQGLAVLVHQAAPGYIDLHVVSMLCGTLRMLWELVGTA